MAVTRLTFSKPPSTNNLFGTNWKTRRRFATEEYEAWERFALQEVMLQRRHQHPGRVRISYVIERGKNAGDLGNREKAGTDMLVKMGIITDDRKVESIYLRWSDTIKGVRARITDCEP